MAEDRTEGTAHAVIVRELRDDDGKDLVAAWEDTRAYYASLEPELFQAPTVQRELDPDQFVTSIRRPEEGATRFTRVAEVDQRAVGFISAHLEEPLQGAEIELMQDLGVRRAFVDSLWVHRSSWGRGVGGVLMAAAEDWASNSGAAVIKTDTYYDSPVSVPFYEALGYERQAIIYRKTLPIAESGNRRLR